MGGDLNLKKSWHPVLLKNQEEVWKREKGAIEERKRVQQLVKEHQEEKQIAELQRLGGKTEQRVEWLYNAPAAGSGPNTEELEAYLLGKKSVEQLFNEQDRKKMELLKQASSSAVGSGANAAATPAAFQALGAQANNTRDLAAKIKLDPLLAIKQQEQKAYEELMKDPKKLKALRDARDAGKAEKKHKKKDKSDHKHKKRSRDHSDDEDRYERRKRRYSDEVDRSRGRSRSRSPPPVRRYDRSRSRSRSPAPRRRSPSPLRRERNNGYDHRQSYRQNNGRRPSPPRPTGKLGTTIPDAEARLAAMSKAASSHAIDRDQRMAQQQARDRLEEEKDRIAREAKKVKGGGLIEPSFLKAEQQRMFDKKLEGNAREYGRRPED